MKNKNLIYILGPLMAVIWGAIIWKVVDMMTGNEAVISETVAKPMEIVSSYQEELFVLFADYPDPFLKNYSKTKTLKPTKPKPKPKPKKKVPKKPPKPKIDWSFITFNGTIENPRTKKRIAIVNIRNKEYIMTQGDTMLGVLIKQIWEDSVEVNYHMEKRMIKKAWAVGL